MDAYLLESSCGRHQASMRTWWAQEACVVMAQHGTVTSRGDNARGPGVESE